MLKWHFRVFGFAKKFPRKTMWLLDLFGSGSGNLKSQNLKSVPPCACFHGFFSRVLGFPVTVLHTLPILSYVLKYKHFVIYNVSNWKHRIVKVQMRLRKVFNPILKSCRRRLYKVSITCDDVAKRCYSCELSKLLTDTIQSQHIYNNHF